MKQLIIAIIFVGAAAGIFFGWTQPLLSQTSELKQNKQALQDVIAKFVDLRKTKNDLIDQYNSINRQDLIKLRQIVPEYTNEGDLIVAFESLAKDHGLLLKQIDVKHITEQTGTGLVIKKQAYSSLPISIVVDGSYESFKLFLSSIEKSLRVIDINSITFNAGELNSYEFSIKGQAYFKQP